MRIGIFGGSFDPIHCGHLLLAETARTELRLDRVDFVPLGSPPHRKTLRTPGADRFEMTLLATRPYPEFNVSRREIDSDEISYTADTIRHYHDECPGDELFFIVSSETFNDMPNWRRPGEICKYASVAVASRAGYPPPNFELFRQFTDDDRIASFRNLVFESPPFDVSSTMIRRRVAAGKSIRFLVPDAVIEYIAAHGLYANS